MRGNSPANARFPSTSPASRLVSQFSTHDYPVFTPSYEDDSVYNQSSMKSLTISESWDENGLEGGNSMETILADYKEKSSSTKGLAFGFANQESHICPADDRKSIAASCADQITVLQT